MNSESNDSHDETIQEQETNNKDLNKNSLPEETDKNINNGLIGEQSADNNKVLTQDIPIDTKVLSNENTNNGKLRDEMLRDISKEALKLITSQIKKKYGSKTLKRTEGYLEIINIICFLIYSNYHSNMSEEDIVELAFLITPKIIDACLANDVITVKLHNEAEAIITVASIFKPIVILAISGAKTALTIIAKKSKKFCCC